MIKGVQLHKKFNDLSVLKGIDISITEKQRVAQLILEKIAIVPVVECLEELPTTERADGGYGSTGTH